MNEIMDMLKGWNLDIREVREYLYRAPTPRERERWHAIWLLARGWSAAKVAQALERDPHTVGEWLENFRKDGPTGLIFEQTGGPPILNHTQQAQVKEAVKGMPQASGIAIANWNWKVVREFIKHTFGWKLCCSSCLNYLHRLGVVLKRPVKRLLKANEEKREAFVAFYTELWYAALDLGTRIFFVDEAHFRADADLRGKWVLRGEPALVDSTSPRLSEKATYYSGVCLETGEVEAMEVDGNCTAQTSAAFLRQLRDKYDQPLIIIWDNGPVHHGDAIRDYLNTPDLRLQLVPLPGYSPDFNADEAIWDWVREEVTANFCLGTRARVQEKVSHFFQGLVQRTEEVKRRCRTVLEDRVDQLVAVTDMDFPYTGHVDSTLDLLYT